MRNAIERGCCEYQVVNEDRMSLRLHVSGSEAVGILTFQGMGQDVVGGVKKESKAGRNFCNHSDSELGKSGSRDGVASRHTQNHSEHVPQ